MNDVWMERVNETVSLHGSVHEEDVELMRFPHERVTDVSRSSLLDGEVLLLSVCLRLFIWSTPLLHSALQSGLPVHCPSFPLRTFTSKLEHLESYVCYMHCCSYTFRTCRFLFDALFVFLYICSLEIFGKLKGSSAVPLGEPD